MSKPKPRASEPLPRSAAGTGPQQRKASHTSSGKSTPTSGKSSPTPTSAKFYNGRTVPAVSDVKTQVQNTTSKTAIETKKATRKAVLKVKRHPWTFFTIVTALPLLVVFSLFSTILCPPPAIPPSTFSRFALSSLGIQKPQSPHSSLHQTLCYPANVYHREVLQPYVYPVITNAQAKIASHPVYVTRVEPTYRFAKATSNRIWHGPLKPVVNRTIRGAKKFYLTYIQPHLPYLHAKFTEATAPVTTRANQLYNTHFAPRAATARGYACKGYKQSVQAYRTVAGHPLTAKTGKYTHIAFKYSSKKVQEAFVWAKPRLISAAVEAKRIFHEVIEPRAVMALSWLNDQILRGWAIVRIYIGNLYDIHAAPHVNHHLAKARVALSPYTSAFHANVYRPYLLPVMTAILPVVPEPPKSFWSLIADKLPSLSAANLAESKGSMADFYDEKLHAAEAPGKVKAASKQEKVKPVSNAVKNEIKKEVQEERSATPSSSSSAQPAASTVKTKDLRAEADALIESLKEKVDIQGKQGYERVQEELSSISKEFLTTLLPQFATQGRNQLDREIDRMITGLDRLYTASKTLTREQVKESIQMTDSKVTKIVFQVRENIQMRKNALHEKGSPVVRQAQTDVQKALGPVYHGLANKLAIIDGVTQSDWDRYHALKKDVDTWQAKYADLHEGSGNRQLKELQSDIQLRMSEAFTEFDDIFEGFRARVGMLRRAAIDRIEAREVMSESSSSAKASLSISSDSGRVSILPISEVAVAAGDLIGKGKEQIMDAVSQASVGAFGVTTPTGVVEQVQSSIQETVSSVAEAASSAVHDATRSVKKAVGVSVTPESPREHVQSIVDAVKEAIPEAITEKAAEVTELAKAALGREEL